MERSFCYGKEISVTAEAGSNWQYSDKKQNGFPECFTAFPAGTGGLSF